MHALPAVPADLTEEEEDEEEDDDQLSEEEGGSDIDEGDAGGCSTFCQAFMLSCWSFAICGHFVG